MIKLYVRRELAPVLLKEQLAVYIDFPAGGVQVNPKYGNNSAELAKLEGHLKTLLQSADGFVKNHRIIRLRLSRWEHEG